MLSIFVNIGIYLCVVLILSSLLFLVMQFKKDNSLIDIAYGPLFVIAGAVTLFLIKAATPLSIVILLAMTLWSLRLALRIAKKNKGQGEDIRYKQWRIKWMKKGEVYFIVRSFLQINLLQGSLIVIIALPFMVALSSERVSLLFAIAGGLIYLLGLITETIADKQIDTFRAQKKAQTTTATFLTTGLFAYSRRPNYFGETLIWLGLAIMVLPLPYGWLALLSPLTITYIVTVITGPMLENIFIAQYGNEYREYMRKTSYFIPLPPKP